MEESLPVVFVFDKMDCYHRDAFIHAHLPFIVVGIQLYLPFMGIYLQEKYIKGNQDFGYVSALYTATALLLVLSAGKLSLHE